MATDLKASDYSLETAIDPEAWFKRGSEQVTSSQPLPGQIYDPSILPLILKEAARDLHDTIMTLEIGKLLAKKLSLGTAELL